MFYSFSFALIFQVIVFLLCLLCVFHLILSSFLFSVNSWIVKSLILYLFFFQVTIFANYWIINNSGLSLIFRQEGCDHDAAGESLYCLFNSYSRKVYALLYQWEYRLSPPPPAEITPEYFPFANNSLRNSSKSKKKIINFQDQN